MNLTDVAPIATAASSVAAVTTLIIGLNRYSKELSEKKAKILREELGFFLSQNRELIHLIKGGTPLILAAALVGRELAKRLGTTVVGAEIVKIFEQEQTLALSITITAWEEAESTSAVSAKAAALVLRSQQLPGGLSLFNPLANLIERICRDGYSYKVFNDMLNASHLMLKDKMSLSLSEMQNSLVCSLQGTASAYFLSRYDKALQEIALFVELSVKSFLSLPDKRLTEVAARTEDWRELPVNLTSQVNLLLKQVEKDLPTEIFKRLQILLERIEAFIGKSSAQDELNNLKRK